ncbi:MAG: radical SAM protein [Pseudomonadota bacterium]
MSKIKPVVSLAYQIAKYKLTKNRAPIFLCIFLTNKCNLRCKYCFVIDESIPKEILDAEYTKDEICRIIDDFYDLGTRLIFLLGGEPLVHKDIDAIVDHIVDKGIYLQILTNGVLIKDHVSTLKKANAICVSLDGREEINDSMRGKNVYKRSVHGILKAKEAGIPTRVHAVISRHNLENIEELLSICCELDTPLTIAPSCHLGETNDPSFIISKEEYKQFWAKYLQLAKSNQRHGKIIANSASAIDKCLKWPIDYHQFITPNDLTPDYSPVFCPPTETYTGLSATGNMFVCMNLGIENGPSVKELGVSEAWKRLPDYRPNCISCASINYIEVSMLLSLSPGIIFSGLKLHFHNFIKKMLG